MRLYKYFHQERISILSDGLIRFTQPGAFNDPYEMQPYISADHLSIDMSRLYEDMKEKIFIEAYNELSIDVRNIISFDQVKKLFLSREHIMFSEIQKNSKYIASRGNEEFFQAKADQFIGVICLTEKPDNLLMWAHYGNSHEGFVIEFDCEHEFFNQGLSLNAKYKSLQKVLYTKDVYTTSLLDLKDMDFILHKSIDWEYEQEWRMLLQINDCKKRIERKPYDICLFEIPRNSIKRIILGCRSDEKLFNEAKGLIGSCDIALAKTKIKRDQFGLDIIECVKSE